MHFFAAHLNAAFKHAADDALLPPHLALAQFAVGIQAGELGAGACAAGRAVISFARAEHEVFAVHPGDFGWTEQLDVVDLVAMVAGDSSKTECLAHRPGKVGKSFDVLQREFETMLFHEKKPVAAPGHVAAYLAESWHIDRDFPSLAITRNIAHGYFPGLIEGRGDDSDRRLYLV